MKRLTAAPEIPTFAESGFPSFEMYQWYGILAPKGTPADIIDKLNVQVKAAINAPAIARGGNLPIERSIMVASLLLFGAIGA
jgi:tripartite-type tricarboxylate transporter receptor subunit TctC